MGYAINTQSCSLQQKSTKKNKYNVERNGLNTDDTCIVTKQNVCRGNNTHIYENMSSKFIKGHNSTNLMDWMTTK